MKALFIIFFLIFNFLIFSANAQSNPQDVINESTKAVVVQEPVKYENGKIVNTPEINNQNTGKINTQITKFIIPLKVYNEMTAEKKSYVSSHPDEYEILNK